MARTHVFSLTKLALLLSALGCPSQDESTSERDGGRDAARPEIDGSSGGQDGADGSSGGHDAGVRTDAGDSGSLDGSSSLDGSTQSDAGDNQGCRSSAECSDTQELCRGPNESWCGIPPRDECDDDRGCADGSVCHAERDSCSADGFSSRCGAPCTPDACEAGLECKDGHCLPIPCDQGVACRLSEQCLPDSILGDGPVHARTHGCVPIACEDDAPCPEGTLCVNGRCQEGLGTCELPPP